MTKLTAEDCRKCGACCVSPQDQEAYCDTTIQDLQRLNPRWVKENVAFASLMDALAMAIDNGKMVLAAIRTKWARQQSGPLAGFDLCTCVALRGSVMHKVSCRIYSKRPKTCRESVKPGDRNCVEFRRALLERVEAVR